MSDCDIRARLDAYHDGELPAGEARQIEAHVAQCAACATELAALQRLSAFVGGLEIPPVTADMLRRMRGSAVAGMREAATTRVAKRMTAIAATLLAASVTWMLFIQSDSTASAAAPNDWELAAVAPAQAAAGDAASLANWIVHDLSREQPHE